jgi:hypothetical protein
MQPPQNSPGASFDLLDMIGWQHPEARDPRKALDEEYDTYFTGSKPHHENVPLNEISLVEDDHPLETQPQTKKFYQLPLREQAQVKVAKKIERLINV